MDEVTDDESPQSEQVFAKSALKTYFKHDLQQQQVPSSWLECSIYQNYTAPEVLVQVALPLSSNFDHKTVDLEQEN